MEGTYPFTLSDALRRGHWEMWVGDLVMFPKPNDFKDYFFLLHVSTLGHHLPWLKGVCVCVCVCARVRAEEKVPWLALKCPSWIINIILAKAGISIQGLTVRAALSGIFPQSLNTPNSVTNDFSSLEGIWIWKTVKMYLEASLINKQVGDEAEK